MMMFVQIFSSNGKQNVFTIRFQIRFNLNLISILHSVNSSTNLSILQQTNVSFLHSTRKLVTMYYRLFQKKFEKIRFVSNTLGSNINESLYGCSFNNFQFLIFLDQKSIQFQNRYRGVRDLAAQFRLGSASLFPIRSGVLISRIETFIEFKITIQVVIVVHVIVHSSRCIVAQLISVIVYR